DAGVVFTSSRGPSSTIQLERTPLLRAGDFARAEARSAKNASKLGTFELEIVLSERGKTRFNAAAALGRDRKYCVVAVGSLRNCSEFAASEKSRADQSLAVTGLDRGERAGLPVRWRAPSAPRKLPSRPPRSKPGSQRHANSSICFTGVPCATAVRTGSA